MGCKALPELLTHGLQPPADTKPSDSCPKSGGKGLCTTLCSSSCRHCRTPHAWDKCHMFGLGVYLADLAQKSHRYVREPELREVPVTASSGPAWGVGANIRGLADGELWGRVVDEQSKCWVLESGRIAKKETEGWKWQFESVAASYGVGATIEGLDGQKWGRVTESQCHVWVLET